LVVRTTIDTGMLSEKATEDNSGKAEDSVDIAWIQEMM
jgi:hypothetical protein